MEITELNTNPLVEFQTWFDLAKQTSLPHPNAMTLATATKSGKPSARVVLLKGIEEEGLVFYTNYESRKGRELEENPQAALVFHWDLLRRQVRFEGTIERVSPETSNAYFQTRPRESRLAAWASEQSAALSHRSVLEERVGKLREEYANQTIPLPPFWGGYRLVPQQVEFWAEAPNRLHDRFCYTKQAQHWNIVRLSP